MTTPVSSLLKQGPCTSDSQKVPILQAGDSFSLCLARSLPQLTPVQAISPCISCRRGFPRSTQIKCTVASRFWEQSFLWQEMPSRRPQLPPAASWRSHFLPKSHGGRGGVMGRPGGNSVSFWHSQKEKKKKGVGRRSLLNSWSLLSSVQLLSS